MRQRAALVEQGAVDPAYINPRWIPLTADGSGGHIGIDFDPWPGGRIGQVILFGRDEDVKAVLAESSGNSWAGSQAYWTMGITGWRLGGMKPCCGSSG